MLERFFGVKIHSYLHVFCLAVLAAGLSWGKALMSIGFVLLILNFLVNFKVKLYVENLKKSRASWFVLGFFFIYFIGLLWSSDLILGITEIKSRLPMFAIPLIMVAMPVLSAREIKIILHVFLLSLFFTSLINFSFYYNIIGQRTYLDIRGMSHFGSHIRYSIAIVLGIGLCFYAIRHSISRGLFLAYLLLSIWFVTYTFFSEVLTGLISLVTLLFSAVLYLLWKWRISSALVFITLVVGFTVYFLSIFSNQEVVNYNLSALPTLTVNGNPYEHSNDWHSEINGLPIYAFWCDKELEIEWNKSSKIPFDGNDKKKHRLNNTLVRYMTAMNINKDSLSFQKLTKRDIINVEEGFVYPTEKNEHFFPRLNGIKFQLINRDNPNGHSLLQRLEYWSISKSIIEKKCFFGVGTGGNSAAFASEYSKSDNGLMKENQLRSHNMFLSYWISFGVMGMLLFCGLLIYLLLLTITSNCLFGFQFISILAISCLIEDTLETQMGVTMFGIFVGFILNQSRLLNMGKPSS